MGLESSRVIGSCDGLLALADYNTGAIILCNISTRKLKIYPSCLVDFDFYYFDLIAYGFGRGSCSDDYKLVMVTSSGIGGREDAASLCQIYSLKTESWRKVVDFPSNLSFYSMAVLFKGTLNWFCSENYRGSIRSRMLSFDLNSENFFLTALPDRSRCEAIHCEDSDLKDGGEYLCWLQLILDIPCTQDKHYSLDIWVMKEYGVEDSWIKMYTLYLPAQFCDLSDCVFSEHFDELFFYNYSREVCVWDLKDGRCKIRKPSPLWSEGLNFTMASDLIFTIESLVSLGLPVEPQSIIHNKQ